MFSMVRPTGVEISEKPKVAKTNCHFENFQNAVNLIYTVCLMWEMMISTALKIVGMVHITGVDIS